MKMHISELAQKAGVSVRTLQYYDSIGLLKPVEIKENGYRSYDEESLKKLEEILRYKSMDIPLKDISAIINEKSESRKILLSQRKAIVGKRHQLKIMLQDIDRQLSEHPEIDPWFDKVLRDCNYSGMSLHIHNDDELFCAWGYADYENQKGFTPDTLFPIGGITQQFTAAAVIILFEQGKLSPNDDISRFYPEYKYKGTATVCELLTGEKGISSDDVYAEWYEKTPAMLEDINFYELPYDRKQYEYARIRSILFRDTVIDHKYILRAINSAPPLCGDDVGYENYDLNIKVLGDILVSVCQKPLQDVFNELIFRPLEMDRTSFGRNNADAVGYADGKRYDFAYPSSGSDGIISTLSDLSKFYFSFMEGKLFNKALAEKFFSCLNNGSDKGSFGLYRSENGKYGCRVNVLGIDTEVEFSPKDKLLYITVRNQAPIPCDKSHIMYFPVKACTGLVHFNIRKIKTGADANIISLKVFDENACEMYVHNREIILSDNDNGKCFDFDISEALGDEFGRNKSYYIEVRSAAKAADVYDITYLHDTSDGDGYWYNFTEPYEYYDMFMAALNAVCNKA